MRRNQRHSAETRAKMSEARKRALADPEVRAKMSEARKRAWADPEVRAKMSEARKRRDPEIGALTDPERDDYRTFRKAGYSRSEALQSIYSARKNAA